MRSCEEVSGGDEDIKRMLEDSWIKKYKNMNMEGRRGRGRMKRTHGEVVKEPQNYGPN